jgi:signal transduction histidine kinase
MRERVIQCGGKMKIHSDTTGTKISITLPFVKSERSPLVEPIQMQSAG